MQSSHLVQLREMLPETLKLAHTEGTSNYKATLQLFPELLLHHQDEYMAALIQEF